MLEVDTQYIEIGGKEKKIRFRRSLFWDVPASALDLDKNRRLILERVFSRGNIEEFQSVNQYYTWDEIRESVKKIGYLDNKTLHFISKIYQIKSAEFKCYKKNL
jgi:hypothetical protein